MLIRFNADSPSAEMFTSIPKWMDDMTSRCIDRPTTFKLTEIYNEYGNECRGYMFPKELIGFKNPPSPARIAHGKQMADNLKKARESRCRD